MKQTFCKAPKAAGIHATIVNGTVLARTWIISVASSCRRDIYGVSPGHAKNEDVVQVSELV